MTPIIRQNTAIIQLNKAIQKSSNQTEVSF